MLKDQNYYNIFLFFGFHPKKHVHELHYYTLQKHLNWSNKYIRNDH